MSLDHPLTDRGARAKRGGAKTAAGAKRRGATTAAGRTKRGGAKTASGRVRRRGAKIAALLLRRGRVRLFLAAAVLLAILAGGCWLWLRDSSLVRVTRVEVTGVTSSAEPRIDAALDAAARGMTTLNVDHGALDRAVAGFPSVAGLAVHTDFPHGMTIDVLERRPVAAIVVGSQRIAVTGDGRLLRDVQDTMGLPAIALGSAPVGEKATGARVTARLAVAAAAPPELRRRTETIGYAGGELRAELVDGPPLVFGTPDHAAAKWAAAARVLAAPSAAGATYLDLRVPGRVAAGGLQPVTAEDPQDDALDPTAAAGQTGGPTAVPTPVPTPTPTATPYSQP